MPVICQLHIVWMSLYVVCTSFLYTVHGLHIGYIPFTKHSDIVRRLELPSFIYRFHGVWMSFKHRLNVCVPLGHRLQTRAFVVYLSFSYRLIFYFHPGFGCTSRGNGTADYFYLKSRCTSTNECTCINSCRCTTQDGKVTFGYFTSSCWNI